MQPQLLRKQGHRLLGSSKIPSWLGERQKELPKRCFFESSVPFCRVPTLPGQITWSLLVQLFWMGAIMCSSLAKLWPTVFDELAFDIGFRTCMCQFEPSDSQSPVISFDLTLAVSCTVAVRQAILSQHLPIWDGNIKIQQMQACVKWEAMHYDRLSHTLGVKFQCSG